MRKLRVAFLINNIEFLVSHRLPVAREALKKGYEVYLLGPYVPVVESLKDEGFKFIEVQMSRSGTNPLSEILTIAGIYKVLRNLSADLVHLVTMKPIVYGGICTRLLNTPAVVSAVSGLGFAFLSKGLKAAIRRWVISVLYRWIFRHPNHQIVFQNTFDRDMFIDKGFIRSAQAVLIRGSGVDLNQFRPTPEPTDGVRVLFASRFLYDKGIEEFVNAARIVKSSHSGVRFILVGAPDDGNPASVPLSQINDWVSEGVVECWGHSTNMAKVFSEVNIVVLPSYREGLPKVLIEAAASQRAIITTNVPGCSEVVRDGYNGILVPEKDSPSLAKAIEKLVQNSKLRLQFAEASRKRAEEEFFIGKVVQDTMAIYDKSLAA